MESFPRILALTHLSGACVVHVLLHVLLHVWSVWCGACLQARIREAAARQNMPGGSKTEGEAERRMRELYEERLLEYGDLAKNDDEQEEVPR